MQTACDQRLAERQPSLPHVRGGSKRDRGRPYEISTPCGTQKVQDKAATCQNYVTYPVVHRETISCVPPKMKTPEPPLPHVLNLKKIMNKKCVLWNAVSVTLLIAEIVRNTTCDDDIKTHDKY